MTDKRLTQSVIPWTGGLNSLIHPSMVPVEDMSEATDIFIDIDGTKRKRAGFLDQYGVLYTASSASTAFGAP